MSGPPIVGRAREVGLIAGLLDRVGACGAAFVLDGAAGIGKSTLLADARLGAVHRDMLVLTTAGVQSETDLPFAGLHQLLRPILCRKDDLPPPQRGAVSAAFGMAEGAAPELFLIALGALGLLSDAAADRPLLLSVEDAHWLDRPSAEVLAFVGRRVESDPIVLLAAIREGYESPLREAGLPELHLDGLSDEAARGLLDGGHPGLPPAVRERLLAEAKGNPLALLELAVALGSGARDGGAELPAMLPLTARMEQAFAARVAELPDPTRTLLRLAAVDEEGSLARVLAAAEIVDGVPRTIDDLVPAARAQLIEAGGPQIVFRHSLVRSAIYQAASVAERHAAHRALAEVLADDPDRRVWHRAAAVIGTDDAVAAELEEAGRRALRRGAVTTAAAAFERAAALLRDTARQGGLLLEAAAAASDLGRREMVARLMRAADALELGPYERARWKLVEDSFTEWPAGDLARVRDLTRTATQVADLGDPDLALALLTTAASRCWWGALWEEGREVMRVSDALGVAADDQSLLYIQSSAMPVERGGIVLRDLERTVPPEDAAGLYLRAIAVQQAGAYHRALPLLTASARRLRAQGRLRLLAQVLAFRAWAAVEVSDFAVAVPSVEEARRLSVETGQSAYETGAGTAEAALAAMRGDRAAVETLTAEAERAARPIGAAVLLSLAQYARGQLALGAGRHSEAYRELLHIYAPGDPAGHRLTGFHVIGDFVEAAAHSGHLDEAKAQVAQFEPHADRTPGSRQWVQMLFARVQLAIAADNGDTERVLHRALSQDLQAWPMFRARLLLTHGEWLRRRRRLLDSRVPLRAARDSFDALGVVPWAERARRELRAAGESSPRRTRDSLDELTPQELQIAQMAARGLSNREIAERLYLSHRTIESHLYRVFPKLGVASRAQLGAALRGRLGSPA
jgi:DNA-binding CsgD family transcriptional regulator